MLHTTKALLFAAALLGTTGIAAAQKLSPLGIAVKNGEASIAVDINPAGQVAGVIQNVESGSQRASLCRALTITRPRDKGATISAQP
jgi:hypothetical protein